ncbi:MAG: cytochrome C [Bacteroidetes bacterium]|nr:cytochrome C [Bacteroidota bacterium]MBU1680194.1 cytochrome C [Bacteroidota bacterium]MBU2505413.1 cytochrome C [Bacteroidota bacterium]
MKTKQFYFLLFAVISLSLFLAAFNGESNSVPDNNKSVIKFSHQFHLEMDLDCVACHTGVSESTALTDRLNPEKDACAVCHDVEDSDNCQTCHYEEDFEPLIQKSSSLIFNHQFHITSNSMECQSCHKGLESVAYSFESAGFIPGMDNCYTCHNNASVASNACESCHITTVDLIPLDHKSVSFMDAHKFKANDADCAMCHDNNFCESCHVATIEITESNKSGSFYTPYSPHNFVDGTKQQQLSIVHDLNYRMTHGIDAKGKTQDCATCHQIETFCAQCHNSTGKGDFALGGFVPASHTKTSFLALGVGSGGGEHALLAKRDIESCASCHDLDGADPSCVLCHVDNDGIKGTNPRTHERNFMKSVEGEWHSDFGAVCFNCHTDAAAMAKVKGQGFCSYCHN